MRAILSKYLGLVYRQNCEILPMSATGSFIYSVHTDRNLRKNIVKLVPLKLSFPSIIYG